jgi:hypothetical protein
VKVGRGVLVGIGVTVGVGVGNPPPSARTVRGADHIASMSRLESTHSIPQVSAWRKAGLPLAGVFMVAPV